MRSLTFILTTFVMFLILAGCGKKPEPQKPTPVNEPPKQAPTVRITVSPSTIDRGQSAEVRWSATNATSVSIDGIGAVNPSGVQSVSPNDSTTYRITASGPGGSTSDSARLTVNAPEPPPRVQPK